jgi:hypothetical protein
MTEFIFKVPGNSDELYKRCCWNRNLDHGNGFPQLRADIWHLSDNFSHTIVCVLRENSGNHVDRKKYSQSNRYIKF